MTTPNPTQLQWLTLNERERDVREGVRSEERERIKEKNKKEKKKRMTNRVREKRI